MTIYTYYLAALLIGVVAGLRTFTALAAVSWAAFLGAIELGGTRLGWLGSGVAVAILSAMAILEFVVDQLPSTPSRKVPMQFAARIVSGAVCGAAVVSPLAALPGGIALGILGAIFGTFGGSALRGGLAGAFHRDRPAAFLEDAVAILGAVLILGVLG
jgi:uncharacterized membrane protein